MGFKYRFRYPGTQLETRLGKYNDIITKILVETELNQQQHKQTNNT